ncbi:hypothetical protein K491DRAFT_676417 [Lophiostoma macrostomum CBS 122681]|uniref:Secreted protein n=1 Tax=Lophiostoma macrostomum CBS 122681 TaxID=1314788 RepID=A0A6A6TF66_9PLEO|nr:hypothetical protein K491DRAFT_676417 [Lophiostoma macrostomum CBS 122681]
MVGRGVARSLLSIFLLSWAWLACNHMRISAGLLGRALSLLSALSPAPACGLPPEWPDSSRVMVAVASPAKPRAAHPPAHRRSTPAFTCAPPQQSAAAPSTAALRTPAVECVPAVEQKGSFSATADQAPPAAGHVPLRRLAFQSAPLIAAVPLSNLAPKPARSSSQPRLLSRSKPLPECSLEQAGSLGPWNHCLTS